MGVDRFWGESGQPRLLWYCEYCGGGIYEGEEYFEHEGLRICSDCEGRYALAMFEEQAVKKTANTDSVL